MLETILLGGGQSDIDVPKLKESVKQVTKAIKDEKDFDHMEADLLKKHTVKVRSEKPAEKVEEQPEENKE
jgi:hypothetical protein